MIKSKSFTMGIVFTVVVAVTLTAATVFIAPSVTNQVLAKISSVPTSCENNGGNEPGGQQPECEGSGLTQNSENQNPAGKAPPGQNK